ncbi:hypothetical protein JCM10296v2_000426 [Rhodotorula toruloides]
MLGETTDPMAGGVDASPRTSSLTATHAWKDVFIGNRTWSSTLFVRGKEIGTGLGPKIVDARDAAFAVYIERAEKAEKA